MTEVEIRAIVRDELRKHGAPREAPRARKPCGRGNSEPQCMGSAAMGPDGCTCPGVRVEFYDASRRYP